MRKKNKIRILVVLTFIAVLQFADIKTSYAMNTEISPYAYDEEFRTCSNTATYRNTMVSINPTTAANGIPSNVKTVEFNITATAQMRYNRVTGQYVSTSSPTITLNYQGPVAVSLKSSSTSYRDNGTSITYTYRGNLLGTVVSDNGVVCTIDYGTFSGSFTVNK